MIIEFLFSIFAKQKQRLSKIWKENSIGFGDTFAKITKTMYIQPCSKCEQRRKSWNERIKYQQQQNQK